MSIVGRTQKKPTTASAASSDASPAKITINSILKRAKSWLAPANSPSTLEGRNLQPESTMWDPGDKTSARIASMVVASVDGEQSQGSRTELDSHANMAVVGRNSFVIEDTGRTADVNPFTPDYNALENIPIVNAALLYECPFIYRLLSSL